MYKIALINGDGIGPEQMSSAKEVLYALQDVYPLRLEFYELDAGDEAVKRYGKALPEHSLRMINDTHACLKAPLGASAADVIVFLRRNLDLYANVRPARSYPSIRSLKPNIDLVIVRENTEDLYSGLEYAINDSSIAIKVISRKASLRIADYAFRLARFRSKKKRVHAVHKANLLRITDGLFARCCREVADSYKDVEFKEMLVDACAMNLIRSPEEFDVIVTMNMFGDILSDEAAQVVGSLGIAPSANIGDNYAIFEPVHGSAPDIAGKGIANPLSLILSSKLMLEWLADRYNDNTCKDAANTIEHAVEQVLLKGIKTPDIDGNNTTAEVTKALIKAIKG